MRIALLAFAFLTLSLAAQDPEDAAVRAAVEHYFRGHATGDGAHFRLAFHPESKLMFIRDGKFTQWTSEEYIGRAKGSPAADEAKRKRSIDLVDIAGNAAMVKVTLNYPDVVFTDYLSLLKTEEGWKIVNKTFYADRKKQ